MTKDSLKSSKKAKISWKSTLAWIRWSEMKKKSYEKSHIVTLKGRLDALA